MRSEKEIRGELALRIKWNVKHISELSDGWIEALEWVLGK